MKWCESKLKPSEGQDIIVRVRDGIGGKWHYQIGIWIEGKFKSPNMVCDMCGGNAMFLPFSWNPFHRQTFEWLPLNKILELERNGEK